MSYQLTVLPDMLGQIVDNQNDFPLFVREGESDGFDDLSRNYTTQYHWHPDLEFILYKDGENDFFINGSTVHVEKGQALFINSRRLHCTNPSLHVSRSFIAMRIRPGIFTGETKLGVEYYERKFGSNNVDFIILDPDVEWQQALIGSISAVAESMRAVDRHPVKLLRSALSIVEEIGDHIPDAANAENNNRDYSIFITMVEYIRDHYAEKLKTEDIANAGHISRAKVFQLFDRYAHISPNTYIINYRITKSCELLRDSDMSIMEISELCGFQTSSYFTRVFSKEKEMTPREYRALSK